VATRRARVLVGAGLTAAVAVAGGLAAAVGPAIERTKRAQAGREARAVAADAAVQRRRLAGEQRPHVGWGASSAGGTATDRRRARRALVDDLQRAITTDARARVRAGALTGAVLRTECSSYPNGSAAADAGLSRRVGAYECVAVNGVIRQGRRPSGVVGVPFWARVDFLSGAYVWCRVNPRPGERGISIAAVSVPLAPVCNLEGPPPRSLARRVSRGARSAGPRRAGGAGSGNRARAPARAAHAGRR
jgi:type II secretory pathway pseudopilin PulG